jgi:two-component system, cell cycle response regulator DivK
MPTILLVEDNEPSRDALGRRLERRGFRVAVAVDGQDAVTRAHTETPDLILMDLGLPGIDGWEATRQLKNDPMTRHIPIIVLSAHVMLADRNKSLAAGADDFDCKPVIFDQLLSKIDRLLPQGSSL